MDLTTLDQLRSPIGRSALAAAMARNPSEATLLVDLQTLGRQFSHELARAALDQALLRQRARIKFTRADAMMFTREALEQSTSEQVAQYRANRFAGRGLIADVGCGIGGDSLAIAQVGPLVALDRDPVRLAMAEWNVGVYAPTHPTRFIGGDAHSLDLTDLGGIFVDPARRTDGQRTLRVELGEPPLSIVRDWLPRVPAIGVKLAPGVSRHELEPYPAEVEFISLDGELKECVLWFGPLRTAHRRATMLSSTDAAPVTLFSEGEPFPLPSEIEPGAYLLDPDSTLIRADLLGEFARLHDAAPLDDGIALLTCDDPVDSPFAECLAIEAILPSREKPLRSDLRKLDIGTVEIRKRGVQIDADALARAVRTDGSLRRVLVLTRIGGKIMAVLARRLTG